jgi:DNA-binding NarL/FixJ family response regulator
MAMNKIKGGKIRIVIADDHSMLIDGLKDILSDLKDLEVVGEATTGEDSVKITKSLKPDIVLMDINLPGISGIAATERKSSKGNALRPAS